MVNYRKYVDLASLGQALPVSPLLTLHTQHVHTCRSTASKGLAEVSKLNGRAGRFGDGRALGGLQSWQRRGPKGGEVWMLSSVNAAQMECVS